VQYALIPFLLSEIERGMLFVITVIPLLGEIKSAICTAVVDASIKIISLSFISFAASRQSFLFTG